MEPSVQYVQYVHKEIISNINSNNSNIPGYPERCALVRL